MNDLVALLVGRLEVKGYAPRPTKKPNQWRGHCPVCKSKKWSLVVSRGDRPGREGWALAICHDCHATGPAVARALGLRAGDLFPQPPEQAPAPKGERGGRSSLDEIIDSPELTNGYASPGKELTHTYLQASYSESKNSEGKSKTSDLTLKSKKEAGPEDGGSANNYAEYDKIKARYSAPAKKEGLLVGGDKP